MFHLPTGEIYSLHFQRAPNDPVLSNANQNFVDPPYFILWIGTCVFVRHKEGDLRYDARIARSKKSLPDPRECFVSLKKAIGTSRDRHANHADYPGLILLE